MTHQTDETKSQSNEVVIITRQDRFRYYMLLPGRYLAGDPDWRNYQTREEIQQIRRQNRVIRRQNRVPVPRRCFFITGLVITNSLTQLVAVSMLMTYLTTIRMEKLINAAATVNILEVLSEILSVPSSVLKGYLGCQPMIILTTQFYIMGMVFLVISALVRTLHTNLTTPSYTFENLLLYMGLFMIVLGKAGSNSSCVEGFFGEQLKKNVSNNDIDIEEKNLTNKKNDIDEKILTKKKNDDDDDDDIDEKIITNKKNDIDEKRNRDRKTSLWVGASQFLGVILGIGLLASLKDWKFRYGVCAVMMQLALGVFLVGSPFYTTMGIDHVGLLQFKCFQKATDTSPPPNDDEQEMKKLKENDEGKEIKKTLLLLVPIGVTFLIFGIVKSTGRTFFLEQGNNMKGGKKSGNLIPPNAILLVASDFSRRLVVFFTNLLLRNRIKKVNKIYAILIRIGIGLIFSVICCATAQAVEAKRLGIVAKHGLQDITGDNKGDPVVPMSVYWLLPQFIFLGAMKGLLGYGMKNFFESELPMCMRIYASEVTRTVTGIGTFVGFGLVSIATKASTIGGGSSWFANTLNRSHLDRYYRSLTILCWMFCFAYACVSTAYMRQWLPRNEEEDCDAQAELEGDD